MTASSLEPLMYVSSIGDYAADDDCACASETALPASQIAHLNQVPAWQTSPHLYRAPINDEHEVAANPFGRAV